MAILAGMIRNEPGNNWQKRASFVRGLRWLGSHWWLSRWRLPISRMKQKTEPMLPRPTRGRRAISVPIFVRDAETYRCTAALAPRWSDAQNRRSECAGVGAMGFLTLRRLWMRLALLLMMTVGGLAFGGAAQAQHTSPYCSPRTATVASGGVVEVDLTTCDNTHFGLGNGIAVSRNGPLAWHGDTRRSLCPAKFDCIHPHLQPQRRCGDTGCIRHSG